MHVEVKMLLGDTSDYVRLANAVEGLFLREETYRDYFFDFPNMGLTESNSVLRLRVPCEKPAFAPSPLSSGSGGGISAPSSESYEEFLLSCAGPSVVDQKMALQQSTGQPATLAASIGLTGVTGKLVFKQNNVVDKGHQMTFVLEDDSVPNAVVADLISGRSDPYTILSDYATRVRSANPNGGSDAAIVRIMERVQYKADQLRQAVKLPDEESIHESDAYYRQVRYTACNSALNSQCQPTTFFELTAVGGYISTRKTYRYLYPSHVNCQPTDEPWRMSLRLRLDRTLFPFGERYEVEVPRIDAPALEDVTRELSKFLNVLGVTFQLGSESKYARFVRGVQCQKAPAQDVTDVKLCITSINGYMEVRKNLEAILLGTSSDSNDKRSIATTDLNTSGHCDVTEESIDSRTEYHENYFFDGPQDELSKQRCFLRLRRLNAGHHYTLVLKEKQRFVDGRQENRTSKTDLSPDVASELLSEPSHFLVKQHNHNAVASVLWHQFGLRRLCGTVSFTTTRISAPWWSAQSQHTSFAPPLSGADGNVAPTLTLQNMPQELLYTAHANAKPGTVPPLIIHLDMSHHTIPAHLALACQRKGYLMAQATGTKYPIKFNPENGLWTVELYEVEVSNLAPGVVPGDVLQELTTVLEGIGVEWKSGLQSKSEQHWALLDAAAKSASSAVAPAAW